MSRLSVEEVMLRDLHGEKIELHSILFPDPVDFVKSLTMEITEGLLLTFVDDQQVRLPRGKCHHHPTLKCLQVEAVQWYLHPVSPD